MPKYIYSSKSCKYIALFNSIVLFSSVTYAATTERIYVENVNENFITYSRYNKIEERRISLNDLIITDIKSYRIRTLKYETYNTLPDFKLKLLKLGIAKLRYPENSLNKYKIAQDQARKQEVGIWAKPAVPVKKSAVANSDRAKTENKPQIVERPLTDQVSEKLINIFETIWPYINVLGTLGVMGIITWIIYRVIFIQRRVRLLIVGEPSVGKSALCKRLLNPKIDSDQLLGQKPTSAKTRYKKQNFIPMGKYEIYPYFTDVPGSKTSVVWDELIQGFWSKTIQSIFPIFRRLHAVVLVLSPTKQESGDEINQRYIDVQLGYLKALINGSLGAHGTAKPKAVILFISKFDLFSHQQPGDSSSSATKNKLIGLFSEHIQSAQQAAKNSKVPFELIIGSSVKDWNCDRIVDCVSRALYGQ